MSEEFQPNWASPPWHTIEDAIAEKGVPMAVMVGLLGLTESGLEKLKRGDMIIDPLFAKKLSEFVGSSKGFWLRRELQYRAARNRLDADRIATLEQRISAHNERCKAECADHQSGDFPPCPFDKGTVAICQSCPRRYMIED